MAAPKPASGPDVVAAGAVVTRKGRQGREVLLVHRPKYDDWSFPKGKQDPGEHVTATAVREVLEETGVEIRLGLPLLPQLYAVSGGRAKTVHYWVGHVVGDDDVSGYQVNDEVDELGWFDLDSAKERLTYLDDIDLLEQFRSAPEEDGGPGRRTPCQGGQARRLGRARPQAAARTPRARPRRRRCRRSCTRSASRGCSAPPAPAACRPWSRSPGSTWCRWRRSRSSPRRSTTSPARSRLLDTLMAAPGSSVLCSHRPVLPELFSAPRRRGGAALPGGDGGLPPPQGPARRHRAAPPALNGTNRL